jgi:hypothetical protein
MLASRSSCASAFFSAALLVACSRATGGTVDGGVRPGERQAGVTAAVATAIVPPSAERAPPARRIAADDPVAAKSIGHTSFVLKVTLAGGAVGAFKPRSKRPLGDRRYRGEIAAYRLATALGLSRVPRAVPRSFDATALRDACTTAPGSAEQFDREALVDADGTIRGAFIDWIDDYHALPLEDAAWRARWDPWVFDPAARIAAADRPLASAISTLIAFDYLTANWDRWSGGNVARAGAAVDILYVDNDGAFYERPPPESLERQLALLRGVVRFSRRFVDALRALDRPKLVEAFGEERPGEPLLGDAVVAAVEERRRTILQVVDDRLARSGARATFAFE